MPSVPASRRRGTLVAAVVVVVAAVAVAVAADAPNAVPRVGVRSVISPAHAVEAVAAESHCAVRSLSVRHDFLSYP